MHYDALIVIDMQNALLARQPYHQEVVLKNIQALLAQFRAKQLPIVYIRHDGGLGDELEKNTLGWQLDPRIAPLPQECVFDKCFNSAFRQTELRAYLESIGAKKLVLCGMQTEYCVDATCKVAFEYEYVITIGQDTTTTFDNLMAKGEDIVRYYETQIWHDRYAQVLPIEEIIKGIG